MPASRPMSNCRTDSATCSCIPTGAANQSAGAGQPSDKCGEGSTPSSARARCLRRFLSRAWRARVDGGIVREAASRNALPMAAQEFSARSCKCRGPVLARGPLSAHRPSYRRPSKRKGCRNMDRASSDRADADNPCTASAPRRSTYPKAGASMREKHLIDVLIAEILPVVAAHALFCHSEFAPV